MAGAIRVLSRSNGGVPPRLAGLLKEFEQLAATRDMPGSAVTAVPVGVPSRSLSNVTRMGATAAADEIGCEPRNIRDLCERGVLDAEKIAGRWQIDPVSVLTYKARRSA